MKTDDLIQMLARNDAPVDLNALKKRFAMAMLIGALAATLLATMWLGVRPDIASVAKTPLFWWKAALPASLILGALWMVTRLARPGVPAGISWLGVVLPIAAVWVGAVYALAQTAPDARLSLILGQTWRVCPLLIALLSAPGLIAIFAAIKGLAPTNLRLAGATGGLLSGGIATLAYCVHCPEMGVPFWACWYVLGMLIPTALGALAGPRFLRW